ncbi:5, 10-methenyltetrahydrofolate synthetase, isoform CRA_a, partial [Mus musculus]
DGSNRFLKEVCKLDFSRLCWMNCIPFSKPSRCQCFTDVQTKAVPSSTISTCVCPLVIYISH